MPGRFLVTGGAGFIGSSIAEALLARGDRVTVLDDFSTGREANLSALKGDLEVVRGDVSSADDVARALRDVHAVFHEAAIPSVVRSVAEPEVADRTNVHGTICVLENARRAGVKRVVFAASAAAYGDEPTLPKREDMTTHPLSPYAVAKIASEHYMRVYASLHGMQTLSLRYFNVFGGRQDPKSEYAAAIPRFVAALKSGAQPTIFGDGEQTRDFCHVSDVVEANLAAMRCDSARGQAVNIVRGEITMVNALVQMLSRILKASVLPKHEAERPGDIRHSCADITLARTLLSWSPRVLVEEGLKETVAGFGAHA
ncbi:MAG: SDR family oxidoreductase [Sandaracinaceae bacterium]|nr:SDR family oxidoreductase [Sandaracinaceae bacterium]